MPAAAAASSLTAKRNAFLVAEGVVAVLEPGNGRGDSGSVLVGGGGSRNAKDPPVPPQLAVATEHYNRIARLLDRGQTVTMEVDVRNTFHDADLNMFNIVAEIPGTDKADEVVMLGAHFDSWHAGTGSVDNASGSAVMLEAMRILKQSGVRLRRTVRMGLWTGEEQGLIGSRMYVRNHFADPADMKSSRSTPGWRATSTWTTAPGSIAASISRATRPSRRSSAPGWRRSRTSA